MEEQKTSLKTLFTSLQNQMSTSLEKARAMQHPGTKGDATELDWLKVLQEYLPNRYKAKSAFVIDSKDECSDQIDIVIFDRQYTPILFEHQSKIFVPAEGVYAVFEVKQELNKKHLKYASAKAESVRKLIRTSMPIPHAGGTFAKKKPAHILAGILCAKSDWSPAFGDSLIECMGSLNGDKQIDIGCSLKDGIFELVDSKEGEIQIIESQSTLVIFLLRLIARLQTMATVPMLDVMAYAKHVEKMKIRREQL